MQCDEKWSFVEKKQKNCDPDDEKKGDNWDHVAFDPESKLVLSVIPGKRTAENTRALLEEVKKRTDPKKKKLITTDEYHSYPPAVMEVFGEEVTPPLTGKPGRPQGPYKELPRGLNYAIVHKTRENGCVVNVEPKIIFGSEKEVTAVLEKSSVSNSVNIAFVERHNGTDRNRNARKTRKTYCFSKNWEIHEAVTYFTMYSYNFCWPVRTLRQKGTNKRWHKRTPAMAAGLTDHIWTLEEWLTLPAVQRK